MKRSATAAFIALGLLLPSTAFAESDISVPDGQCQVEATPIPELECLTIAGDYSVGIYYGDVCDRTVILINTCEHDVVIEEIDCEPEACVLETLVPGDELELDMELPEPYSGSTEGDSLTRSFETSSDSVEGTIEIAIRNVYDDPENPYEPPIDQDDEPDDDVGDQPDVDAGNDLDAGSDPDTGGQGDADDNGEGGCSTSGHSPASTLLTLAGALGLIATRRRR